MSGVARLVLGACLLVAAGDAAQAQGKKTGAILPGADSKQPINIEAGKLDYFDKEKKLIYTGSVVATQGASKLKSTMMTIFLAPKAGKEGQATSGGSTNQVQRMIAVGPVTMVQKDQVGTGDNAVYDKAADTVVMTGNVVLTQGENVTKGDKLVYDLKSGHATVIGTSKNPVIGIFPPGGDSATPAVKADAAGENASASPHRVTRKTSSR